MGTTPLAGGIAGTVKKLQQGLQQASGASNSRKLLIIREDEPVKVRFLQNPEEWMVFYEHYVRDNKAFVPALENDPLAGHPDEAVRRTSLRHMVNVLNLETTQVCLLKMNQDLTNRVMMRYNRYKTVTDRNYEVLRTGSGLQTAYDLEADDAEAMDIDRFKTKLYDMTLYLLQEADRFHGTDYADEYERNNGGATLDEEVETANAEAKVTVKAQAEAAKKAKADAVVGDPDDISHLEDLGAPAPWEEEASAWANAKQNGLPCEKGEDGKCTICSFDVSDCLVAKKS